MIDVSAIGWKEAALVALVILAVYMGYALFRLSMVSARSTTAVAPVSASTLMTPEKTATPINIPDRSDQSVAGP